MSFSVLPSSSLRLGAHWDGSAVDFVVHAPEAEAVDLCLVDGQGESRKEWARVRLMRQRPGRWAIRLQGEGVGIGLYYGYRVWGDYVPEEGKYFCGDKVLLDPYARGATGGLLWDERMQCGDDEKDSLEVAPLGVVVDEGFDWEGVARAHVPMEETVIYELHVKGFSRLFPSLPETLQGTYAALASDEVTGYLKELGVSTVQLMPVHAFLQDKFLLEKGLTNFWGYNSLSFFAPHMPYGAGESPQEVVNEFKGMVKAMRRAGLEVILDVVYNHTAEGDGGGPLLSWKGFAAKDYYRIAEGGNYQDVSGCGNTMHSYHPVCLQMILDSLRYWVEVMGVDGFRFDLGAALGREDMDFSSRSPFFQAIAQDPVLQGVKLVTEPWDIGMGGYQLGRFPKPWVEFNDRYRDDVKMFWHQGVKGRGKEGLAKFAKRVCGSADVFGEWGRADDEVLERQYEVRGPFATLNFVTCHDGFTLHDVVSYDRKHNEANLEGNRDGHEDHGVCAHGKEGEEVDREILNLRERQVRNFLGSLLMSQGVPFLCAGDEMGRTQGGNNNAYCHDNALSWVDWERGEQFRDRRAYVSRILQWRKVLNVFRRPRFFAPHLHADEEKEVKWLLPSGKTMKAKHWNDGGVDGMMTVLRGEDVRARYWRRHDSADLLMMFHGGMEPRAFSFPEGFQESEEDALQWRLIFSSEEQLDRESVAAESLPSLDASARGWKAGESLTLEPKTMACFLLVP